MIGTILTTKGARAALADAHKADCRACMAAARFELIHGRRDAARAYVEQARTHHRQALAIRWRMRSWPRCRRRDDGPYPTVIETVPDWRPKWSDGG